MGTALGRTEEKRTGAPLRRGGVPQKIYWEGINLNKISKKIVSLVTTAAFLTTLVPAAAFAEPVQVGQSTTNVATVEINETPLVLDDSVTGDTVSADVTVTLNQTLSSSSGSENELVFWFEKNEQAVGKALATLKDSDFSKFFNASSSWGPAWWLWSGNDKDVIETTATFTQPGTYTLYVANWNADNKSTLANFNAIRATEGVPVAVGEVTVSNASDVLDADGSQLLIDGAHAGTAVQNDPTPIEFNVLNHDGSASDFALDAAGGTVYIWVEDANGVIVKNAVFDNATDANKDGIYEVTPGYAKNNATLNVTFPNAGEDYTVNCVVATTAPTVGTNNQVQIAGGSAELTPITVDVTAADVVTKTIQFNTVEGEVLASPISPVVENGVTYYNYKYVIGDNVTPNDLKDYKVVGTALDKDGNPVEGEKLTVACQNADLTLSTKEVTTNAKGQFEFTFSLNNTGDYKITVSELKDKVVGVLNITQDAMAPVSISTTLDDGIMLAGTDDNYIYNQYALMSDAVQFNIKDAYDRDATGKTVIEKEAAANKGGVHDDFIDVVAPEGSKLTDADINLAWDDSKGVYTIEYVGDNATADLIPGEYTVKVSLNNGKSATATFTLAEFQGAESLAIGMYASDQGTSGSANNNAITAIDDQVALGQKVNGTVYLVDAQGLKIVAPASNLSVGVNGAAVASNSVTRNNPFSFTTVENIPANQSVIGSIITVKAYDEVNKMYVEKELTVVSNYGDETLSFDPTQGPVGETNGVDVTVVDADGNLSKVNGTMTAYIASQSNEDAKITLRANETVKNGAGKLYLESDKAGTADVVVAVKADNGEIYAGTLTYTFGEEAANAGEYVIMTIGSDQYFINGKMFDGSADKLGAPYIDSAWRTMVPIRALAESFGATVDYADGVVTIVDGDTTVVMNIGEQTYTVNGEEANMDTAPVIGDGDRTYVPVRFVAEALGYSVTPLYGADGLTSSVHFSK